MGSDFAKVDAYVNTAADYEEIPEITDEQFARAVVLENGKPRRGRPPVGDATKKAVNIRLDVAVLDYYRATGPGWQTRINDVLVKSIA